MYIQQIPWQVNYDENELPPWELPELLLSVKNTPVTTAEEWEANRDDLIEVFRKYMYGRRLPAPDHVGYTLLSEKKDAVGGLAVMRQIRIDFSMNNGRSHSVIMLLYIPAAARGPVPVFTGLTFVGNHAVSEDPDIIITGSVAEEFRDFDRTRGSQTRRFPLEEIMKRNYAVAVCSYHDFFPDTPLGWKKSILNIFLGEESFAGKRVPDYTAIGVWAWGISQMLNCLETIPEIAADKAAVFGHSRLGKTALWAGVEDTRFKLLCVNNSGCGGAALSRRLFGETLFAMCNRGDQGFGHYWFTPETCACAETPEKLPIDQHQLIALAAPRAIAVHSATEDLWADPRGEYLSLYHASPVYALYGKETITSEEPPQPETPVGSDMSYFLRTGKHDILLSDWQCYMDIFDRVIAEMP